MEMKMPRKIFRTLLRKEPEGGYTVIVPLLPGCVTFGATMEEAIEMSKEAIELYLESLIARNEPIPSDENVFEYMVTLEDKKYA